MEIEKQNNENKGLAKKLDGLSSNLEMLTREVDKMRLGYKNQRKSLSEPFRFFPEILRILILNSPFLKSYIAEDAEMDIDWLRDKIEEGKFRFSEEDLEKDEKRIPNWHKALYQSLTYLQEMNYISVTELKDSVSKFTIEVTASGARALNNYHRDRRPLYFKHQVSDLAIKIDREAYHFYNHVTGEKIGSEPSLEVEDFSRSMIDMFIHSYIEIPEINKKEEQLKLK